MCATRFVLVLLFAVIACAVAIPAAVPQPSSPIAGAGAPVGIQQRVALEKRQIDTLEAGAGAEQAQDLKGSSSYGYGFYGHPGYYRPYGFGGYGYPYGGYGGYGYGYPYYYRSYYPYRAYGYGGYGYGYGYGGYW